MIELLKKYISQNDISNALLVGQNLFNKNKGNKQVFSMYFNLLLNAASSNYNSSDKFIEQAVAVLTLYSENAEINEDEVSYIRSCEDNLNVVVSDIKKKNEEQRAANAKKIIEGNDSLLKSTKKLIATLSEAKSKKEFDSILKEIYEIDGRFDKGNLVSRQRNEYEELTTKCQLIVDSKLKEFDRLANIEYNNRAVASYEKIFNLFKDTKHASYKPNEILELFQYDSSRLFNETLIYYNHVYNFILSRLNDEEKLTMTKLAIVAEKKG